MNWETPGQDEVWAQQNPDQWHNIANQARDEAQTEAQRGLAAQAREHYQDQPLPHAVQASLPEAQWYEASPDLSSKGKTFKAPIAQAIPVKTQYGARRKTRRQKRGRKKI